jgi:hypothetical protein
MDVVLENMKHLSSFKKEKERKKKMLFLSTGIAG